MIGYLSGIVERSSQKDVVLLVGGVGYKVLSTLPTLLSSAKGSKVSLHVHTHVREDQITLYGFATENELEVFEKLIGVSGIGPKSALAMLSVHTPSSIASAVEEGDATMLSHTPGIGKKSAEKIILDLKGKLGHLQDSSKHDMFLEVRLALEALGYSAKEVHVVVQGLNPLETNTSTLIKEALSRMK